MVNWVIVAYAECLSTQERPLASDVSRFNIPDVFVMVRYLCLGIQRVKRLRLVSYIWFWSGVVFVM